MPFLSAEQGVSGGVGGVGSVVGGGELVINYDSGQVSAFGFGGGQVGWNGGLSASVYGGFVWGLNSSNSNYSKGFTGVNGGAGLARGCVLCPSLQVQSFRGGGVAKFPSVRITSDCIDG